MWFDVKAALAEIESGMMPGTGEAVPMHRQPAPRVAHVARVARPPVSETEKLGPTRPDGLSPDASALLDFLRREGPHTYGVAARELGIGATRAWQAEARLRAAGLVRYNDQGRTCAAKEGGAS
jgi:hypothetical protein